MVAGVVSQIGNPASRESPAELIEYDGHSGGGVAEVNYTGAVIARSPLVTNGTRFALGHSCLGCPSPLLQPPLHLRYRSGKPRRRPRHPALTPPNHNSGKDGTGALMANIGDLVQVTNNSDSELVIKYDSWDWRDIPRIKQLAVLFEATGHPVRAILSPEMPPSRE